MLLEHGYNDLGIQALLGAANVPKGAFYHHFAGKQDFALARTHVRPLTPIEPSARVSRG